MQQLCTSIIIAALVLAFSIAHAKSFQLHANGTRTHTSTPPSIFRKSQAKHLGFDRYSAGELQGVLVRSTVPESTVVVLPDVSLVVRQDEMLAFFPRRRVLMLFLHRLSDWREYRRCGWRKRLSRSWHILVCYFFIFLLDASHNGRRWLHREGGDGTVNTCT